MTTTNTKNVEVKNLTPEHKKQNMDINNEEVA